MDSKQLLIGRYVESSNSSLIHTLAYSSNQSKDMELLEKTANVFLNTCTHLPATANILLKSLISKGHTHMCHLIPFTIARQQLHNILTVCNMMTLPYIYNKGGLFCKSEPCVSACSTCHWIKHYPHAVACYVFACLTTVARASALASLAKPLQEILTGSMQHVTGILVRPLKKIYQTIAIKKRNSS